VLDEWRVVGSAAEVADADIFVDFCVRMIFVGAVARAATATVLLALTPLFVDGTALGAGHFAGDIADERLERGNGGRSEIRTGDADVHVEVGHGVLQFLRVLFDPFGGTDQTVFFSVPTGKDDRALRLPAALKQGADAVDGFKHCGGAAVGVDCAVNHASRWLPATTQLSLSSVPGILPMTSQMGQSLYS